MSHQKRVLVITVAMALGAPVAVQATNGMNLEGYGPIAHGMGGASMGYDNGTAAMMNNPATLGLMGDGNRLDAAFGSLGPNINSSNSAGGADSSATAFYMPAVGWAKKTGALTYGVGMFAQGGMGAEYEAGSAVDQTSAAGISLGGPNSDAHTQRSELGVGRLLFPVAFNVNQQLTVGGSVDVVWGGLDILWSMDARNFLGGLDGANIDDGGSGKLAALGGMIGSQNNRSLISGTLVDAFVQGFDTTGGIGAPNGAFNNFYWGNFEFSDNSDFTQASFGTGFAGKLGFAYKVNNQLTIGGVYHLKTAMSDLKGDIDLAFKVDTTSLAGSLTGAEIPVSGEVKVKDFQWPETYGLGIAYQATDKLLVAADWKRLEWSEVMKEFHMVITADSTQANPLAGGFAGTVMDFVYMQNWDDQDVIQLGVAYQYSNSLTLRAGYNYASNPIPDDYVSFLFPATVEQHFTAGFGMKATTASSIDFSVSYAPKVEVTETNTETNNLGTTPPTTISHSQVSWQMMYSHRF